jgi:hypothetical protein
MLLKGMQKRREMLNGGKESNKNAYMYVGGD